MTTALAVLFTISLIILVHEWGHFFVARSVGVKVERFSIGFGPRLFGITRKGTEYAVCLFPLGGYVKMAGDETLGQPTHPWEYRARPLGQRMRIILAGPLVNYLLGYILFVLVFTLGTPVFTSKVGEVTQGSPAQSVGLKSGDRILSINGERVETWEGVARRIHSQTSLIHLEVERDGSVVSFSVYPNVEEQSNLLGGKVRVGRIGIKASDEFETFRYPFFQAIVKAGERIWFLTVVTLQTFWYIASGSLPIKESLTGPIGIFSLTSAVAEQGLLPLLHLVAVLSTSLGLFNLFPVPVLDGGHLLFLFIEKLRGSPISLRVQEAMTKVGLVLLLLLLVVVTYNDLIRYGFVGRILKW